MTAGAADENEVRRLGSHSTTDYIIYDVIIVFSLTYSGYAITASEGTDSPFAPCFLLNRYD